MHLGGNERLDGGDPAPRAPSSTLVPCITVLATPTWCPQALNVLLKLGSDFLGVESHHRSVEELTQRGIARILGRAIGRCREKPERRIGLDLLRLAQPPRAHERLELRLPLGPRVLARRPRGLASLRRRQSHVHTTEVQQADIGGRPTNGAERARSTSINRWARITAIAFANVKSCSASVLHFHILPFIVCRHGDSKRWCTDTTATLQRTQDSYRRASCRPSNRVVQPPIRGRALVAFHVSIANMCLLSQAVLDRDVNVAKSIIHKHMQMLALEVASCRSMMPFIEEVYQRWLAFHCSRASGATRCHSVPLVSYRVLSTHSIEITQPAFPSPRIARLAT